METSTYDPCLLISTDDAAKRGEFSITGLQTDDTLSICTPRFADLEEKERKAAGFEAKSKTTLSIDQPFDFNGAARKFLPDGRIHMLQKRQGETLAVIHPNAPDAKQQYVEQRARGAYSATICVPQVSFGLSTAAQVTEPEAKDVQRLNEIIQWMIDNSSEAYI